MLGDFGFRTGECFSYEYDFGDGWQHGLLIEAIGAAEPQKKYPLCIGGGRACPPEDSGVAERYREILDIIAKPRHPEKRELKQWLGRDFDPETFRRGEINRQLRQIGRMR